MPIDPLTVIRKYYPDASQAYEILLEHSHMVTEKALAVAQRVPELEPDLAFIREAAMLHDIGIIRTHAPGIGCHGEHHYLEHGVLGREMLEQEGLPRHGLVCERHVGVGLRREDILAQNLPLPLRDMQPESLEEQIICYADKFFSKKPQRLRVEKPIADILRGLSCFGEYPVKTFEAWLEKFREPGWPGGSAG